MVENMTEPDVKQQVRKFYDQVGWQLEADGLYQNAHYEDLRPVSAEYIHRCHGTRRQAFENQRQIPVGRRIRAGAV